MQVGFIGLGVMGLPMASHILAAGHEVTVASRSRGPIDAAVALGALDGRSPSGVAESSDVVVLCVPDSPDVASVVEQLLPGLRPGAIVVDCSTIDPELERAQHASVAAAGGRYLDAPVSGGDVGARNGTLTLMVGGDADVLEQARPVLECFSARIVHVGGPGDGQVVKLANNALYAIQMAGVAEVFTMMAKSGIDLARGLEVLLHSSGDCTALRTRVPFEGLQPDSPVNNGWKPGFATSLMAKDVRLALAHADRVGAAAQAAPVALRYLQDAEAAGYGNEDMVAMGKVVRAAAGLL